MKQIFLKIIEKKDVCEKEILVERSRGISIKKIRETTPVFFRKIKAIDR